MKEHGLLEGNLNEKLDAYEASRVPVDWEGCEYSKCGRTDRGVSAFGQVIGVRVRSARRLKIKKRDAVAGLGATSSYLDDYEDVVDPSETEAGDNAVTVEADTFDPIKHELPYIALLNKVLPPTIRILAWCPFTPPNFSARFSCKERLYKYFFTNPAFLPQLSTLETASMSVSPSVQATSYLNIDAMREAASYLEGSHDFRNFCKVDPTKQITSFVRRITHASIDFVSSSTEPSFPTHLITAQNGAIAPNTHQPNRQGIQLYNFTVRGSAFLWHQVRCMVAILFLVGQGLEKPSLVKELLDVTKNLRRPQYEMASDKPLVLWDCTFSATVQERYAEKRNGEAMNGDEEGEMEREHWDRGIGEDELEWVYADEVNKWGRMGLMEDLWRTWRGAKVDEVLTGQLLDLVASQGAGVPGAHGTSNVVKADVSTRVFQGDDAAKPVGRYVPVMKKELMDPVEVINARWTARKERRPRDVDDEDASG